MSDVKGPKLNPSPEADSVARSKQYEEPAEVYVDLTTGKVCADDFEETPRGETQDPNVAIETETIANTTGRFTGIKNQD